MTLIIIFFPIKPLNLMQLSINQNVLRFILSIFIKFIIPHRNILLLHRISKIITNLTIFRHNLQQPIKVRSILWIFFQHFRNTGQKELIFWVIFVKLQQKLIQNILLLFSIFENFLNIPRNPQLKNN